MLYIGDAQNKGLYVDAERLKNLGFFEIAHDRLPDVLAYVETTNWLFLVEAVHSSNPISSLRHKLLEDAAANCSAGLVFVSVFKDRSNFAKWVKEIDWETEVWLADSPEHMIHFNGDRFLGPHQKQK